MGIFNSFAPSGGGGLSTSISNESYAGSNYRSFAVTHEPTAWCLSPYQENTTAGTATIISGNSENNTLYAWISDNSNGIRDVKQYWSRSTVNTSYSNGTFTITCSSTTPKFRTSMILYYE